MKKMEKPVVNVVVLEEEDIIRTSCPLVGCGDNCPSYCLLYDPEEDCTDDGVCYDEGCWNDCSDDDCIDFSF